MFTNSIPPSLSPALKSHLEAQCNFATELSRKLFDTAQQLSELHLRLAQDLLQEWSNASQQLLSARDTGEFMSLAAAQVQLSASVCERLEALINQHTVTGARYNAQSSTEVDTEEFA